MRVATAPIVDYNLHGGGFYAPENSISFYASTIGLGRVTDFGPVWSDAIDIGLFVRSHKTGKLAVYVLNQSSGTHRNVDRDITHWELFPVRVSESMYHKGDVAPYDTYKDTKLVIFNT